MALDPTGEAGNDTAGVWVEAQGGEAALEALKTQLLHAPPPARVEAIVETGISGTDALIQRFYTTCGHLALHGAGRPRPTNLCAGGGPWKR